MITPSGLHFERSHSGIPDIDPDQHRLVIHGLVKRPLVFTLEALSRYPMQSRIVFLECAGNSQALNAPQPQPLDVAAIHGLLGCQEWTGVRLATLLDEAGVEPAARWVIAEGADGAAMSRSIPLTKAMDDALVCLYQNGERVRPSNGYPVRLLLPGFEGNMNVKWLRRLKVTSGPAMTKDETSRFTILLKEEKAWQFVFPIEVKSLILRPSPGLALKGPGFYEISGLAWSGNGRIRKVDVSADAGRRQPCKARSYRRRRFAFAPRGNGMAVPPCCRAAPPTTAGWCSRPVRSSRPSAVCVASFTTTRSRAGGSMRRVRSAMYMLKRIAFCAVALIATPALAQAPKFGQPIAPADVALWDISIGPDGAGFPSGRGAIRPAGRRRWRR
jgi:DMSO/TMAO reductase YedYZ molybdopterin-dependent catalytic subunit